MKLSDLSGVTTDRFETTHIFQPANPVTQKLYDFKVEIRSTQSDAMRAFYSRRIHKLQKEEAAAKRTGKVKLLDMNEIANDDVEECAALLVGIDGLTDDNGELIGADEYRDVLHNLKWLRNQIKEEAEEEANFFQA